MCHACVCACVAKGAALWVSFWKEVMGLAVLGNPLSLGVDAEIAQHKSGPFLLDKIKTVAHASYVLA